jgi:hypothetical protein
LAGLILCDHQTHCQIHDTKELFFFKKIAVYAEFGSIEGDKMKYWGWSVFLMTGHSCCQYF